MPPESGLDNPFLGVRPSQGTWPISRHFSAGTSAPPLPWLSPTASNESCAVGARRICGCVCVCVCVIHLTQIVGGWEERMDGWMDGWMDATMDRSMHDIQTRAHTHTPTHPLQVRAHTKGDGGPGSLDRR